MAYPRLRRFGQHFLAPAWADKVVEAIAPAPDDRFLEIGPGAGILTRRLAARAAHVTAIEIDRGLAADLRQALPRNADVVTADVLDVDLQALIGGEPVRVAGNLPYNISSPILFRLLGLASAGRPRVVDATVMLQREVADRLAAHPGTRDYGVLTISATTQSDVQRLLVLPPGAFRPAPKVHSALVRLTFKPSVVPAALAATFTGLVRSVFTQRRKTLSNALKPFAESVHRQAASVLSAAGIDPSRRPETLDLDDLIRLASLLVSHNP